MDLKKIILVVRIRFMNMKMFLPRLHLDLPQLFQNDMFVRYLGMRNRTMGQETRSERWDKSGHNPLRKAISAHKEEPQDEAAGRGMGLVCPQVGRGRLGSAEWCWGTGGGRGKSI